MTQQCRGRRAGVAIALAVASLTACNGTTHARSAPTVQPRTSAAPVPVPAITVRIGVGGAIKAPPTLHAGITHFVVTGTRGEALQLVTPRRDQSASTLVADYRQFAATDSPAGTERDFRFVGGSFTGSNAYLDLPPGVYYAFDAGQSTLTAAHVADIDVRGKIRGAVNQPGNTGAVTAIGRDMWSTTPAAISRSGYLQFTNSAHETHLANLLQLKPATTLSDVKTALSDPNADVSKLSTGIYAELGVLSPGDSELVSYRLPSGNYALLDLWPDDTTGKPQAALGMVRLIRVG